MAGSLSDAKRENYRTMFNLFDTSGDGKISSGELREALKKLNREPSDDDLKAMIDDADKNKSGVIEFEEFVNMMLVGDEKIEDNLEKTFKEIDKNGSGFIDLDEMNALFKTLGIRLTQDQLKAEMAGVDVNSDGKLSLAEFKKMWKNI